MTRPAVAVIVVGVGHVPQELIFAAESILGPLDGVCCLCFEPRNEAPEIQRKLRDAYQRMHRGKGVLFMADLCGSSLANACYEFAKEVPQVDVICGTNLAMLMKLFSMDRMNCTPTALARLLADTGRKGICLASDQYQVDSKLRNVT